MGRGECRPGGRPDMLTNQSRTGPAPIDGRCYIAGLILVCTRGLLVRRGGGAVLDAQAIT